ncbi:MAG: hypothetical protein F6J93_17090 [Oscillatoria sp. SIO1A7]|nr:hypothetical protein [Oscillatoria sp. SIO1A7]
MGIGHWALAIGHPRLPELYGAGCLETGDYTCMTRPTKIDRTHRGADIALARVTGGEWELAVHPLWGTQCLSGYDAIASNGPIILGYWAGLNSNKT